MTNPKVIALLVAAAIAVAIQNYVFWTGGAGELVALPEEDEEGEEFWEDGSESADTPLAPVGAAAIADWREHQSGFPRNPFATRDELGGGAPVATEAIAEVRPVLDGTLWSESRRIAFINGRPHREGDRIGDRVLERIEPQSVVLRRGAKQSTLHIKAPGSTDSESEEASSLDGDADEELEGSAEATSDE